MNEHRTASAVTMGTHRLWKSLWTGLGLSGDNAAKAVGADWGIWRNRSAVPSTSPATHLRRTAPVDLNSRSELGIHVLSPASTDPIATTFLYLNEKSTTQQAGRAVSTPGSLLCHTHSRDTRPAGSLKPAAAAAAADRTFIRRGGRFL